MNRLFRLNILRLKVLVLLLGICTTPIALSETKTVVTQGGGKTGACFSRETAFQLATIEASNHAHDECWALGNGVLGNSWNFSGNSFPGYSQCFPCGTSGEFRCAVTQAVFTCVNMDKENKEKADKARAEEAKQAKEQADRLEIERQKKQKEIEEKAAKARAEQEKQAKEKAYREEVERQRKQKEFEAKAAKARAEQEKQAKDKAERERLSKQKETAAKTAKATAEKDLVAKQARETNDLKNNSKPAVPNSGKGSAFADLDKPTVKKSAFADLDKPKVGKSAFADLDNSKNSKGSKSAFASVEEHYAEQKRQQEENQRYEAAVSLCTTAFDAKKSCIENASCGREPAKEVCVSGHTPNCATGPGLFLCPYVCDSTGLNPKHAEWESCLSSAAVRCASYTSARNMDDCVSERLRSSRAK